MTFDLCLHSFWQHNLRLLRRASSIPIKYPAGPSAGVTDSGLPEDQHKSHAELYGGASRVNFRNGSLGTLRHHSRGATNPMGNAAGPRGNARNPGGSAKGPRGGGHHASAYGRGDQYRGCSVGRSTGHSQQTRGPPSPHQPVSVSSRQELEAASRARGKHTQHGSSRGHHGPHRQSRKPGNKAEIATFPYAQQSGYPC